MVTLVRTLFLTYKTRGWLFGASSTLYIIRFQLKFLYLVFMDEHIVGDHDVISIFSHCYSSLQSVGLIFRVSAG